MNTVCVVGASLAGLLTARALRGQGHEGRIVVVGEEPHRPYDRPPLSKDFLKGAIGEADLALEGEGGEPGIEWRLGVAATGLDAPARRITLSDGGTLTADGIVIATGAAARRLPGTGGLAGVHSLRTLDDARALRADLRAARRVVVIGGGFIGAEVAATARELGLDVTLVESGPAPLAGVIGPAMAGVLAGLHERRGVRLITGAYVTEVTGTGRADGVRLADGTHLPADVVVAGIGATPCTGWLAGSGVELGRDVGGGVLCDEGGGTGVPGIVAVGDCAAWYDPALGRHHRIEHWTGARQRATVAAATLLSGGTARPEPARPPYFWSDQYDVKIQFIGHPGEADTVTVEEGDPATHSFLAVFRQGERPVAVLGVNQVRLFTRWRRHMETAPVHTG
ncbi:NADPH-dependent 2,4-dienoyl-CoA reductase/sulfur reductase-like enzyme [Nonomuraea muscovyensis]|uniref:NADPH-dependent 2,4-dienoyl-CoA reductase/sulfur reductase-like enzyme n=1 Tax=Nonomuraea muscovyensis TaxID=1124761 RepID=A0A7X0EZ43_9ACTN|nr:FAD-dependent oxidoreductase [Nonomuraea muscovyensis]MBB6346341.1 NADPH-dependent 2,4-dienoyl-CoA reductase/sulfur reductase-like enzyme [Nonomuraea muscovyensis]